MTTGYAYGFVLVSVQRNVAMSYSELEQHKIPGLNSGG